MSASLLPLQVAMILTATALLHAAMQWARQPAVIAELAAGVALSPFLLGAIAPALQTEVFGARNLSALSALGEFGLILYMFTVGSEIRLRERVRSELYVAVRIGIWSFIVPASLGVMLGQFLFTRFAPPGITCWTFSLFVGCALGATALPVMARILSDRGLLRTDLGRTALSAAAVVDVLTWALLMFVMALASSHASFVSLAFRLGALLAGAAVLFGVLRPALERLMHKRGTREPVAKPEVLLVMLFALAQMAAWLGIHPALGAFLFGACIPREDQTTSTVMHYIERVGTWVLMPIFFAVAGLSAAYAVFADGSLVAFASIVAVAIAGKVAGAVLGGRMTGQRGPVLAGLACLMNARGLMEVVVAKVGLGAGVIDDAMFAMLLSMAAITTIMAGPLIAFFVERSRGRRQDRA